MESLGDITASNSPLDQPSHYDMTQFVDKIAILRSMDVYPVVCIETLSDRISDDYSTVFAITGMYTEFWWVECKY